MLFYTRGSTPIYKVKVPATREGAFSRISVVEIIFLCVVGEFSIGYDAAALRVRRGAK